MDISSGKILKFLNNTNNTNCENIEKLSPIERFYTFCEAADYFAFAGFFLCLFFFISPIFELNKIRKNHREIINFPKYSLVLNLVNTSFQIGIVLNAINDLPFNFIGNLVGAAFNICYFLAYLILLYNKDFIKIILIFVGKLIILASIMCLYFFMPQILDYKGELKKINEEPIVAFPAIIVNIFMFIAPMQNLHKAYKNSDSNLISLKIAFIGLFFSGFILIYGILVEKYFIYIPNGIGLLINIISIFVYFSIRKQNKEINENSLLQNLE